MGMPQIPDGANRPTLSQTLIDLLESIALEEMAMAHIMNAEGEKMQAVIQKYEERDVPYLQLEKSCKDTQSMINNLIMKEWLLLSKMNNVLKIFDVTEEPKEQNCRCVCGNKLGSNSRCHE